VLDVIKFSHGDMLTWGVFTVFSVYLGLALVAEGDAQYLRDNKEVQEAYFG
jgi:branched-subunit amino acid ABC-type transport system permease component